MLISTAAALLLMKLHGFLTQKALWSLTEYVLDEQSCLSFFGIVKLTDFLLCSLKAVRLVMEELLLEKTVLHHMEVRLNL